MGMKIEKSWHALLKEEIDKPYIQKLKEFLSKEKKENRTIYPPENLVFNAFSQTPFDQVKVVIVGQDPYHGAGQAHGLCFSVPEGVPLPPSLKNIFLELEDDLKISPPSSGCLTGWAKQGVLLLNTCLTVRASEAGSHSNQGWEQFTEAVIRLLSKREKPLVFLLWGKWAQDKALPILSERENRHMILTAAHPSPFSAYRGFLGCRHFSKTNEALTKWGMTPIDWGRNYYQHLS